MLSKILRRIARMRSARPDDIPPNDVPAVSEPAEPPPVVEPPEEEPPATNWVPDPELDAFETVFEKPKQEPASYITSLHATRRQMALLRSLESTHPFWQINHKRGGYEFAARAGIRHPEVIAVFGSIEEVDPTALPERFLIKPDQGSTNRGVRGLEHQADGTYLDKLSGQAMSWDEIVAENTEHRDANRISAALSIEELLSHPLNRSEIPNDFKAYTFYDRVGLIVQRDLAGSEDRSDWRFKYWSRDWQDVGPIRDPQRWDADLAEPLHAVQIVEAAETLGRIMKLPFMRIDFYDTPQGPVFGEFTLMPGPPEDFEQTVDDHLGRLREWAEARLLAERITQGHFAHLEQASPDQ